MIVNLSTQNMRHAVGVLPLLNKSQWNPKIEKQKSQLYSVMDYSFCLSISKNFDHKERI